MNYHFFASEADKLQLLDFLFQEADLQVFDSYSPYGQGIREYKKTAEVTSAFDLKTGGQFAVSLSLWAPSFLGAVRVEKITLNPKYCKGHTFRYSSAGLGLLHLHLGGEQNSVQRYSNLAHVSQKKAMAINSNLPYAEKASSWNWTEITKAGRQLKYVIHQQMSVDKRGNMGILPGAAERQKRGIILR